MIRSGALPPLANPRLMDIVERELLTPEDCADLLGRVASGVWGDARLSNPQHREGIVERTIRSTRTVELPVLEWPQWADVVRSLESVNDEIYRFRLDGVVGEDLPSVLRYDASTADHFRPHVDVGQFSSTRKLTFVVQLSDPDDYLGGDLIFPIDGAIGSRAQGTLLVFPAFTPHQVTPVVHGQRHAIVGWLHGPTFT